MIGSFARGQIQIPTPAGLKTYLRIYAWMRPCKFDVQRRMNVYRIYIFVDMHVSYACIQCVQSCIRYAYTHVCTYVGRYVYVSLHAYIPTYIHTYVHTYIHTMQCNTTQYTVLCYVTLRYGTFLTDIHAYLNFYACT